MSKTKTNIINADILNSKINVENKNNVYDINTPCFNYLNSIPNSCGKLMSFNKFDKTFLTFRKYFDNSYIDYYESQNKLEDSDGNSVILDNPKTVVDSFKDVPKNFLDITRHYYITTEGLFSISGEKLFDIKLDTRAVLFELKNQKVGYIRYYSNYHYKVLFFDEENTIYNIVNENEGYKLFYDENQDWLFSFNNNKFTIYDNLGEMKTVTFTPKTDLQVASGAIKINNATEIPSFSSYGKTFNLSVSWYNSDDIYVQDITTGVKYITRATLVWENDNYAINYEYKTFNFSHIPTATSNVTKSSIGNITCLKYNSDEVPIYLYLLDPSDKPVTNEFFHYCYSENNTQNFGYLGVKDSKQNILLEYKKLGDWIIYKFDGQYFVTFSSNLVLPIGFIDKIYDIYDNTLIYLSSIDQKIHKVRFTKPTVEELFELETLTYLPYDSNLELDPFADNNGEHFIGFSTVELNRYWYASAKLYSSYFVLGNNINYLKQNNNLTLATDQEYYFPKILSSYDKPDGKEIFNSSFGEVYFYKTTPEEEYSTIPLAYQNESGLELDLEVERDIANRMPIPIGSTLKQLTPNNWIFRYQDTVFKPVTFGGSLINAFDLTSESLVASTDTLDNVISLRGNLYTIKNNSIYSVNEDFSLGSYLSSLGRMKYLCNNDNLILFYDEKLKRLMSYDASNSWSVYLNIPLLDVVKGAISNQNEIILFCKTGVLIQHNDTMTFIKCSPSLLSSSNGAEFAIEGSIYSPGTSQYLELQSSWLGMTNCRQLIQLDTIYLELEPENNTSLNLEFNIEMLVDKEIKAGEFKYNIQEVGNLKYIRIQPTVQRCNAFRYHLKTNGSIKRISYSVTQDVDELQTVTADVVKEIKL